MKRLVILSVLVAVVAAWPAKALAQMRIQNVDDPPRRVAYWELGGNAMISANVDVLILSHTSVRLGGFLFFPLGDPLVPWSGLVTINQLIGGHGHSLEIGVGGVAMDIDPSHCGAGPTATIGYRLQSRHRVARVGLTTSAPRTDGHQRGPTLGFSVGGTF